jgi:hypothetical protein
VGKPEGRRTLGKSRRRWEDNIKNGSYVTGMGTRTALMWLRIRTGGGRFLIQ